MGIYIKDLELPKDGFIELLISSDGIVQQTGQSCRIDGMDYYTPYVGEIPAMFHAENAQDYESLLKAAKAMHTWIFLNSADEQAAYAECKLSDEMNSILGYSGRFVVNIPEYEEKT